MTGRVGPGWGPCWVGAGWGAESALSPRAQLRGWEPLRPFCGELGNPSVMLETPSLSFLIFFFSFSSFPSLSDFFPFSFLFYPIFFLCSVLLFPLLSVF